MCVEYDHDYIRNNPILTICARCHRKEPIHAPTLENVVCFWCGPNSKRGILKPVDAAAYQERLSNLWRYTVNPQLTLGLR